jgi:hypothetical protein
MKRRSSIGLTVDGLMAHTVALLGLPSTMAMSPSDFSETFTTIAFDDSSGNFGFDPQR